MVIFTIQYTVQYIYVIVQESHKFIHIHSITVVNTKPNKHLDMGNGRGF